MPSLSQLLTGHRRLLLFDASSTRTQVGLLQAGEPAHWRSTPVEAGTGIFSATDEVLRSARTRFETIGAFAFCEGPGSMLGVRTVAMALRTWQELQPRPVFAYQSLAVAGHFSWAQKAARAFTVIVDARRDTWHCQRVSADGGIAPLQRLPAAALPEGELATPENFRAWSAVPRPMENCSYDLATIFAAIADCDCFRAIDDPDAFQHEAPDYKKWSAQIHQSPLVARP